MALLTTTIFLPLAGALAMYLIPRPAAWRWVAALASGGTLALAALLALRFDWAAGGPHFEGRVDWIPGLGASYHVGLDGLSLPLVLLTALLTLLVIVDAWREEQAPREYYALYLVLETGLLGLFATLDLLLFYLFWEVAMVPMYFLIGVWGQERRREAALKFFLYTRVSALALLLGILALYLATEPNTFDLPEIIRAQPFPGAALAPSLILLAFFIAFAIKLPAVPLHSWLPDAHTEASTGGSVILAGLLLKMGGYGFLRVGLPTIPGAFDAYAVPLAAIGVFSAIYGVAVAMAQTDLKRLIAVSSINHMGYVLIAVAVAGAAGAAESDRIAAAVGANYQMVAHGLVTGALFFLVGMLGKRAGTRAIAELSGVWKLLPLYGSILAFAMFASLGLPGLAHFAAEVQIVLGTLGAFPWAAVGILLGILLTTAMFLWTLQRVLMGDVAPRLTGLPGLAAREYAVLVTLVVLTILLGILPAPWVAAMQGALRAAPLGFLSGPAG